MNNILKEKSIHAAIALVWKLKIRVKLHVVLLITDVRLYIIWRARLLCIQIWKIGAQK